MKEKQMEKIIIAVNESENKKTGEVAITYAPIQSCSKKCPFLNNGCYAQLGHSGIHLARINKLTRTKKIYSSIKIAEIEAKQIDNLKGDRPLRLHISGDCKTPQAARVIACAADRYIDKGNQPVWTYTHSWKEIPRDNWGKISVLASCETLEECKQAIKRGYAASIVRLKEFYGSLDYNNLRMVACKELTKGIQCKNCKLCFNDKHLIKNKQVICFFPHGCLASKARDAIRQKDFK